MSRVFICLVGLIVCAATLKAQQKESVSDSLVLEQIVITASKIPLSQRETTKPVIIINRQQIEQSGSRNIAQLLNQQSGIRVNDAYGSPANPQMLFMQGASASYTLILIDGLAINDPSGTGGTYDLRSISLNNVEQIEILKGSQSTLYGSDAMAGVVNIITRKGGTRPVEGSGEFSYGSYHSLRASTGLGGTLGQRTRYILDYQRESSDGFSAAEDPGGPEGFTDDGLVSDSFFGRADLKLSETFSVSPFFHFNHFTGDYDDGAFADADNEFTLKMVNPGVQFNYKKEKLDIRGGYNHTQTRRTFSSFFGKDLYEARFNNADIFAVYSFTGTLQLLAGLNHQISILPENEGVERFDTQLTSPYATLLVKNWNGFSTEAGLRVNRHTTYGINTTYSLAPSFHLTDDLKIFGSLTSGFKAPTLSELFGPFGANPALSPQTSRYRSVGMEAYLLNQSVKLSAQYFNREIDDLIIYTFDSGFINRDRQNDSGFELAGDWIAGNHVRMGAHYNYVRGNLKTLDESGKTVRRDHLIRRPAHAVGIHFYTTLFDHLLLRIDGEYNSERKDLFFNPANYFAQEEVSLRAYTLVNMYVAYRFMNNRITLFSDIRNLLDTDFTEVYGFNTAGFSINGGLRFAL